jgi:hypothetical protein
MLTESLHRKTQAPRTAKTFVVPKPSGTLRSGAIGVKRDDIVEVDVTERPRWEDRDARVST